MLKYLTKITMDIFPSVLATIIGAYIVNHYINAKPADAPTASAVSQADPRKGKPAEISAVPGPGVTARGFSEKAVEKVETKPIETKSAETKSTEIKSAETKATETKPAEAVNTASEPHHQVPTLREKVIAKIMPSRTPAPAVTAPPPAAPAEAAAPATPEEHKDATDLARAAIQRLRNAQEGTPRAQEAARAPEPPRTTDPARIVAEPSPAIRPLPPPITVSSPGPDNANPPYTSAVRPDPNRPIPPADIPALRPTPPIDLRADAAIAAPRERANVAEDVLSAAKSVFQSVLPKSPTAD